MSKSIVLTGATGFLGSHLCRALVGRGYTVHAYRRTTTRLSRVADIAHSVRWHDLPGAWETPFRQGDIPEAVIHCAALYGYGRTGEPASEMIEANLVLPVRLYTLAADAGVPFFFNTDTVLGPSLNTYALSKDQARQWLEAIAGRTPIVNLKVQHFYGPAADRSKFVTYVIEECLAHSHEIRLTDGRQRRDFIYVEDVVSAFLALLEAGPSAGGRKFAEYEIGTGSPVEVRTVVERIHQLTHSRARLVFGALPYRPGEPVLTQADTAALRALGWQPRVDLEEGLKRTIESIQKEPR